MNTASQIQPVIKHLYKTALLAVNPYRTVLNQVKITPDFLYIGKYHYDLSRFRHIYVIGAGKAAGAMAKAIEKVLSSQITGGLICIGHNDTILLRYIAVVHGGHPLPDKYSVLAAQKTITLLENATANDLIIYLASGGGSAMMTLPVKGIRLCDLRQTTRLLINSGATMPEINCVRKHLDALKGGRLAEMIYPAVSVALVLSDIIGDRLNMVGGGPTLSDPTTFRQAKAILQKYKLWLKISGAVRHSIISGVKRKITETPKPNHHCFRQAKHVLIGNNRLAINAIAQRAMELGLNIIRRPAPVMGEARTVARNHARYAVCLASNKRKPLFILSGGETTVTVKSSGIGGRNQEYALAFALEMERLKFNRFVCLSAGTDGVDHIPQAAGAIVDGVSIARAEALGLSPKQLLADNDSYHFHKPIDTLIKGESTGTNVNDIQIIAVW